MLAAAAPRGAAVSVALVGGLAAVVVSPMMLAAIARAGRQAASLGPGLSIMVCVAAAAAGGWAAFWSGGGLSAVAWWLLLVPGVGLAVVDWREHRLPTWLVAVAGVGIAGAFTAKSVSSGDWGSWWQAAAAAVAAFVVFYAVAVASGLGYGDVKLAAVIAGCAGYTSLSAAAAALMAGFLAAGVAAGVLLVGGAGRGSAMALGPWLLLGAAASLAYYG